MKQLDYCMANPLIADQGFSYVTTYVYMSIHRHIASMYTDFVQFLEYQGLGLHGIMKYCCDLHGQIKGTACALYLEATR